MLALLVLVACGDDGSEPTPDSPPAQTFEPTAAASTNPSLTTVSATPTSAPTSTGPIDYAAEAEKFIDSSSEIAIAVAADDITDTICHVPADARLGTSFSCEAVGEPDERYQFDVEITGQREITVLDVRVLD